MLIITTQARRKLVKRSGYAYFVSYVSGGITATLEEGPEAEKNKNSEKRLNANIGMTNNFFQVNY